jgi:hypothetical protein
MNRLAIAAPIALVAALLAGCGSPGQKSPASASFTPQQAPYFAGTGVVQGVTPAPAPLKVGAAGATAGATQQPTGMQRLRIRMDDGRMLYVDTPSTEFQPGTRVQLSANNEIRRL